MATRYPPGGIALIFYYHRLNRYSFNALAGAIDGDAALAALSIEPAQTDDDLLASTAAALGRCGRVITGLSVLTTQLEEMRSLLRKLRSEFGKRVTIVAGGPHATADPRGLLDAGIDVVLRGEAEESFPAVLRRLAEGENLQGVDGVSFRSDDAIVVNPAAGPVEIDAFSSFSPKRRMFGPIEITRGCPFACSFCQTSHIFGTRPRHRSIDRIAGQAATLRSKNGAVVRLLSPNAFSYGSLDGRSLNTAAIEDLLAVLRKTMVSGARIIFGHFPSEVRPEHVTPETLDLLRRYADNDEIVIGAQSGSRRMLEACRRSHSVGSVLTAVGLARNSGYKVIVDFILGLPGESDADVKETVEVMTELSRLGARIHPHAFVPLPQTAFAAERPGRIAPEVLRTLERLQEGRGVYGDWIEQRRLANQIYRRRNPIRG